MATMQARPAFRQSGFPGSLHLKSEDATEAMLRGANTRGPSEPTPEEVESEDDEMVYFDGHFRSREGQQSNLLTKNGKPDRRFKGQRDLPEEEVINPNYRKANTGPVVDEVHLTIDGAPDRRFKENRNISDEEAEILKAQLILQKHGRKDGS